MSFQCPKCNGRKTDPMSIGHEWGVCPCRLCKGTGETDVEYEFDSGGPGQCWRPVSSNTPPEPMSSFKDFVTDNPQAFIDSVDREI